MNAARIAPWPHSTVKRLLDLLGAAILLLLLWPPMLLIGLGVYLQLGHPVFFRQPRPGKGAETFILIKFRSLRGENIPPTGFCKGLRASGLDELPELWNILKGDMSFVGPRPLLVRYLPRYSPGQQRRHQVRPGLTGWAQVHGRNALDWDSRLKLDVEYVDTATWKTDLKILWKTLTLLGRGEGTAEPGEFMGTTNEHE